MTTAQLAIVVPAVAVLGVAVINALLQARVNRQTLDSQRKLAIQARISATYEDLLDMVGWQMEVVNTTKPILTMGNPPEPPPKPDDKHTRKVQARVGVHGSKEVKEILERWAKRRNEFFNDAWYLDSIQNYVGIRTSKVPTASPNPNSGRRWRRPEGTFTASCASWRTQSAPNSEPSVIWASSRAHGRGDQARRRRFALS